MDILVIISLITLVVYVYKIQLWRFSWDDLKEFEPEYKGGGDYAGISVVVAFRNELKNIENLLIDLRNQDYPPQKFEVIVVDDHSDDESYELADTLCSKWPNFRCLTVTGNRQGKKTALKAGILSASNELIVTTDADAIIGPGWLKAISRSYMQSKAALIIGLVDIQGETGFLNRFAEAEFASLVAAGAGAAAAGHPMYCNGANMAYRKSLFTDLTDPMRENITSGDDTFMLHAAQKAGEKIVLLKSIKSLVRVKGPESLKEFFHQRIRWLSKSRHYKHTGIIFTALLVLLMNALMVAAFGGLISGRVWWLFPFMLFIKSAADYALLAGFNSWLGKSTPKMQYILFCLIYPFYALTIAVAPFLSGYNWKDRSH